MSHRSASSCQTGRGSNASLSESTTNLSNSDLSASKQSGSYSGSSSRSGSTANSSASESSVLSTAGHDTRSDSQTDLTNISQSGSSSSVATGSSAQTTATESGLSSLTAAPTTSSKYTSSTYSSRNTQPPSLSLTQTQEKNSFDSWIQSTYKRALSQRQEDLSTARPKSVPPKRRLYFVRAAERMDKMFNDWEKENFGDQEDDYYNVTDLNQTIKLMKRTGGVADYRNDTPITEMGHVAGQLLGRRLRHEGHSFSRIYVSPALRCVQTAADICRTTPLCIEPGLFESLSQYQTDGVPRFMTPAELLERGYNVDASYEPWLSCAQLSELIQDERTPLHTYARLAHLIQCLVAAPDSNLLIVAHGITIDACARPLCGKPFVKGIKDNDLYRLGLRYPYCSALALEQQQNTTWTHSPLTPCTYLDTTTAIDLRYFNR